MVSEGIHCDLWEFRLNLFGDVVRERKHGAAVAAFGIVERLAIGTFAGSGPIILRDRDDLAVGTFAQPFFGPLHDEVAELGIGEAKLGVIVGPFAFDHAVPTRMVGEIFLGWNQRIERMTKTFVTDAAAELGWNLMVFVVDAVADFPNWIEASEPVGGAVFERGLGTKVQIGNSQVGAMGNIRGPGCPPADAALILQKAIYRVDRPAWAAASEKEPSFPNLHHKFLRTEFSEIKFREEF